MNDPASSTLLFPVDKDFALTTLFSPSRLVALSPPRPLASSSKLAALLLTVGGSLALAGSASAQQFKVTATGAVTLVSNGTIPFNSSVAVGTPFTFSYLFDYSAPSVSSSPSVTIYSLPGANAGATSVFGDYQFTPGPASFNITYVRHNGGDSNRLDLTSASETVTGFSVPLRDNVTDILIGDNGERLFSSDALPSLSAYGMVPLNNVTFQTSVIASNGSNSNVVGSITSMSAELVAPAAVPEVSTWVSLGVLLGLGGLGLAVRRRRVAGA